MRPTHVVAIGLGFCLNVVCVRRLGSRIAARARRVFSIPPVNRLRMILSREERAYNTTHSRGGCMFKTSMAKVGLALLALAIITGSFSAQAQDISQASIKVLQDQINALQKQLEDVKAAQAQAAAKAAQAEAATKAAQAKRLQRPPRPHPHPVRRARRH